jgi:hypothetical protein
VRRRRAPVLAAAALCGALLCTVAVPARADGVADLEKAHDAYVARQYDEAEKRLRVLLDPKTGTLRNPDDLADARMYLGAVLVDEKRKPEAERVFEDLLLAKYNYDPDPLRVSLDAMDAFRDAKERLKEKLNAIKEEKERQAAEEKAKAEAARQKEALRVAMLEKLATTEIVREENSRWTALIPFGVGQFQNGQTALGWVFLSTEAALAAGSFVGAGISYYDASQATDAFEKNDRATAEAYQQRAQIAAITGDALAGGFFLVAVLGVVHAQLTFVPEHTEVRKRALPPLSLTPVIGPGGVGLVGKF